jgi:hypothetical protein
VFVLWHFLRPLQAQVGQVSSTVAVHLIGQVKDLWSVQSLHILVGTAPANVSLQTFDADRS